ncbi:TRAP-type C4-dicarboxylate transport system permease small subunit [Aliiruegeria haliotis]|uniref:TRAP transporter small permease protein n=1 Tax=Aliiruegeria haliotis TaxID=1280846 RepID=A0A2T0RZS3_9RHOB|nr:TRAP transporter small permease [Aliiruegeria haliotis]PRY26674.1 TRAP-type C4-dicarboxylate transport system permease small subunit [Aliiruegeria haliotis]
MDDAGRTPRAPGIGGRAVEAGARWLAWLGGAILAALSVMTVVSIIGRALDGYGLNSVPGDYELVANGCAIAVFFFLPWCQLKRGHVTVDLLTDAFPPRVQAVFGLLGDLLVTLASAIILRQLWFGFGEKLPFGSDSLREMLGMGYKPYFAETTYELLIPVWTLYGAALVGAVMMVIVGVYTVLRAFLWVLDGAEGTP